MKNVIIDLGNYNIKYFCNGNKGSFSSKYMNKFNPNGESYERVEIDGKTTYIGVGTLSREFNKVKREYLPQVLYAIDKATNDNDINLCLLLPIVQMTNKGAFVNALKEKIFYYKVNDKVKTIKINKVVVLPEGYVSYYALDNIKVDDDILIIDIGSRTINYSWFSNNKIQDSFTEKLGIFDLYSNIKEYENIMIHEDTDADKFIKSVLENEYTITSEFIPSLTYIISNSNAVIPSLTGVVEISPINFYIIMMLSRFYGNYSLLFSDNSYVTNDFINIALANTYIEFCHC